MKAISESIQPPNKLCLAKNMKPVPGGSGKAPLCVLSLSEGQTTQQNPQQFHGTRDLIGLQVWCQTLIHCAGQAVTHCSYLGRSAWKMCPAPNSQTLSIIHFLTLFVLINKPSARVRVDARRLCLVGF